MGLGCWVAQWVSVVFLSGSGWLSFWVLQWVWVYDLGGWGLWWLSASGFFFFWWWWLVVASCGCGCGYGLLGLRRKWWVSSEKDTIRIERKKYSKRIKIIIFK